MKNKKFYKDILIIFILIGLSFLFGCVLSLKIKVTPIYLGIYLSFYLIDLYFILKVGYILYKTYKNRKYSNKLDMIVYERKIYGYSTLLFLLLIGFQIFRFACIIIFLIMFLLYLLATLAYFRSYRYMIMRDEKKLLSDEEFIALYGEDADDYNLFVADFYKEGYELFNILTDNTFGILNNFKNENIITLLSKLNKSNYLIFMQRSLYFGDINLLCGLINDYLRRLDINFLISTSDITKKDNEFISNRRNDFYDTFDYDLECIDLILRKKKLRIVKIGLYDNIDSYLTISIVSDNVYKKLVKYRNKQLARDKELTKDKNN